MPKPIHVLVRHFPTEDDVARRLTKRGTHSPLLPTDDERLRETRGAIESVAAQAGLEVTLWTSTSSHAIETAQMITSDNVDWAVRTDPRIDNIDQGAVGGLLQGEFRAEPLYWAWHRHPIDVHFPDGEGLSHVRQRVTSLLSETMRQPCVHVIVSHTTTLQVMSCALLGLPIDHVWAFSFAHYRISVIYGGILMALNVGDFGQNRLTELQE